MAETIHGGRVWEAARELGLEPADILDFSANLNPLGSPESVLRVLRDAGQELLAAYPDEAAPRLRSTLCARHGAPNETLVLGAGGAALLFLAMRALAPRRVLVPMPCFQEQPRALLACGAELVSRPMAGLHLDLEHLDPVREGCDAVLLTNPHNPTGQMLRRAELECWVAHYPGVALVVDEAFMDYAPDESLLPGILARPRTVILRSLTKFFAMPGLRVGHAFAHAATAARMRALQESWPVGQLELLAAEAAAVDSAYEARSLAFFQQELPLFRAELEGLGLKVRPSAAPFLLAELPRTGGAACAETLRRQGILVRTCTTWPGLDDRFLRLALRGPADRQRLLQALQTLL